jgi:hypothetical protein
LVVVANVHIPHAIAKAVHTTELAVVLVVLVVVLIAEEKVVAVAEPLDILGLAVMEA